MPGETIKSTAAVEKAESEGGPVVKAVARRIRALNKRIRRATDLEAKIEENPGKDVNKDEVKISFETEAELSSGLCAYAASTLMLKTSDESVSTAQLRLEHSLGTE